jgi:3-hydroxyisobutyrate dehydrogenase-like beta-hydroxyacid dehydrogenase
VPAFRATHLIVFALSAKYSAAPLWRGANVDVAALLGLWLATPDAQEGHPDMARIAFLGLGNMGQAMAARLLQAGHDLTVYNRTAAKAEPLVRQGACAAATPRAAANGAEAVIAMVGDDAASRGIWLGADGALAGAAAPNAFAFECSTLSQDWVQELSRSAARRGLRYIDCPVTGLPDMAAAGELTLLVGAAPADLAAAEPLLRPLCAEMIRFGDIGAGTAYKLIVNLMGAVQIAATAEALLTAERAGLDHLFRPAALQGHALRGATHAGARRRGAARPRRGRRLPAPGRPRAGRVEREQGDRHIARLTGCFRTPI